MIQQIAHYIGSNRLILQGDKVLVALSGGADSVALLLVLQELGYGCEAAHCNFHLRGEESLRDERFVRRLCQRCHIPLHVRDFDATAYARTHGVSIEMACRELRYQWFEQLLVHERCQVIAVAHHRDDNIETFFLNAIRASGIAGLAGMRSRNGHVVRPLLGVSRQQVLGFLAARGQDFVTDSTNLVSDVKRNRLRNIVLPAIYGQFPGAATTLEKTIAYAREGTDLLHELLDKASAVICQTAGDGFDVSLKELMVYQNAPGLLYGLLKPYGFNHHQCESLIRAARGEAGIGRKVENKDYVAIVGRTMIEVIKLKEKNDYPVVIGLENSEIDEPIKLMVEHCLNRRFNPKAVDGKRVIALDCEVLKCSRVVLRHWHEGDRFSPFGMRGSKLVSDLFTDLKLSERDKRKAWILEADGQILWVVGYRASSHYRVAPGSNGEFLLLAMG